MQLLFFFLCVSITNPTRRVVMVGSVKVAPVLAILSGQKTYHSGDILYDK